ncbi:lactonase family protein [Acidisoma sp. C75]
MLHPDADHLLIIGTYTDRLPHVAGRGRGVEVLGFDSRTGAITPGGAVDGLRNPTWVVANAQATRLYAIEEVSAAEGAALVTFALDPATGRLTRLSAVPAGGDGPCHASLDAAEGFLFLSNYGDGSVVSLPLDAEGLPVAAGLRVIRHQGSGPNAARQEGPHVHQALPTPDGRHVLVCEAGLDRIFRYPLEEGGLAPAPDLALAAEPGSFPRHLAFLPDGSGFLVLHELGNRIDAYRLTPDGAARAGSLGTLPADWRGDSSAAAIRIHPSGRFAYASNRGHDSILGVDLVAGLGAMRAIGWWSTEGSAPRDFTLDPAGRFLLAANQNSDSLLVFMIDQESGVLRPVGSTFAVNTPVCIAILARG